MFQRKFALTAVLALLCSGTASAIPIVGVDWDTLAGTVGGLIAGPTSDVFVTAPGAPIPSVGSITNNVYFDTSNGIYTYTHDVTPSVPFASEFNTGFAVQGFNGVAGWSFSDAQAAGGMGLGGGFELDLDLDGTLDWETGGQLANVGWGAGEKVTFFFQSVWPPQSGSYNLTNSEVGRAVSFAPSIPEPSTYLLFGSALALFALRRRKKSA